VVSSFKRTCSCCARKLFHLSDASEHHRSTSSETERRFRESIDGSGVFLADVGGRFGSGGAEVLGRWKRGCGWMLRRSMRRLLGGDKYLAPLASVVEGSESLAFFRAIGV
jgi:hypothetical protein